MKRQVNIVLHKEELKNVGIEIKPLQNLDGASQIAHRDDHYLFVIQQKGDFLWELDFDDVKCTGTSLCFIIPGQVHRYVHHLNCEGWLLFVETGLIPSQYREIFNTYAHTHQVIVVENDDAVFSIVPVLEQVLGQQLLALRKTLMVSLIETIVGLMAIKIVQLNNSVNLIGGPKYGTVVRFKQLVNAKSKELKQVNAYASLLHITPLYLNEVVKEITGFPASYWINQEILLEAKRMLYYTSLDVKQIAFEIGYEDHAYFSRFFKKNAGLTALEFRKNQPLFVQS